VICRLDPPAVGDAICAGSRNHGGPNGRSNCTPHALIYSTPTCPDCKALKGWLKANDIAFTERDLTDPAIAEEAKARTGVRVAPITVIGEHVLYGTFLSQRPRLEELLQDRQPA